MKKFFIDLLKKILQPPASFILKRFKPDIIGITGSAGKTSTKEAIYFVLKEKFGQGVKKSEGNLNTRLGLPLAVLGFKKSPSIFVWPFVIIFAYIKAIFIRRYPKILILEYAIDYPGEFRILTSFAKPKIAVITAIGPAHLEFFKDVRGVFEEKVELVKALDKNGFVVLNENDPEVLKMAEFTRAKIIYFRGKTPIELIKKAAQEVAKIYGIDEKESEKILSKFKMPPGRLEIKRGIRGSILIDDCYNANPLSMRFALNFLKKYPGKRKIAVLGDMLELGGYTRKAHEEIGRIAKENCDLLITTGVNARLIAKEGGGLYFHTKPDLINYLLKEIKEGDIILIKASRGAKFEEITAAIWKR